MEVKRETSEQQPSVAAAAAKNEIYSTTETTTTTAITAVQEQSATEIDQLSQSNSEIQLHKVIEDLSATLAEKNNQIIVMETQMLNEYKRAQELAEREQLQIELNEIKLKHSRLSEAHKKLQKVNSSMEEKLFKLVDRMADEKKVFQNDMSVLNDKLVASTNLVRSLQEENEKCRNEIAIAVQLLKCKPVNSIAQKHAVKQLPRNVQETIRYSMNQKKILSNSTSFNNNSTRDQNSKVPFVTYPPTAMVYQMSKLSLDNQSDENSEISVNDLVRLLDNELKMNGSTNTLSDEIARCECCCTCDSQSEPSPVTSETVAVQSASESTERPPIANASSSSSLSNDSARKSYKRFRSNDSLNAAKLSPVALEAVSCAAIDAEM